MKNLIVFFSIIIFTITINAQQGQTKDHSKLNINCKTCHTCDVPTKSEPCLVMCPREKIATVYQKPEQTPALIVIDQLSNRYSSVNFSHRIHAQMSEMGGGCKGCHHYNTSGPILKCSNCHDVSRKRENVSVPDLNGAYHRQCIDCHREWSGTTDCNSCHLPKKEMNSDETVNLQKKYSNKNHPAVLEPKKIVYRTNSDKGNIVTFYHNEHTGIFGIECKSCHKDESCSKCHSPEPKQKVEKISVEMKHKTCSGCHDTKSKNECESCHSTKEMAPFTHLTATGFNLKSYHSKLSCVSCHKTKTVFSGLNSSCQSCHDAWNSSNFNHKVTGLALDETHSEFDCTDCHENEDFSKKPYCEGCHDELTYPDSKPGNLIKK
ncbi:MAG TPA: cytochrome c3 family protein, partial [Ignavibacteriaceae bacterium]